MKKEIEKNSFEIKKIIFVVSVVLLGIFAILMVVTNNVKDYRKITLKTNKNTIFSSSDLIIKDIEYSAKEKEVIKKLGKPRKEKKYTKGNYKYKKLEYKGIKLTLRENYKDYMLVGAEITKRNCKTSRNTKVGENIEKVIKKYKIDNEKGIYMYGNYSANALKEKEIKNIIYLGVRGKKEVTYVYRDAVIDGSPTNVARLTYTYKNGKVKKITWLYDFE